MKVSGTHCIISGYVWTTT